MDKCVHNIRIGDKVRAKQWGYLCCGSGVYEYAIVLSVNPLILVSRHTDMRWDNANLSELTVIGRASFWTQLRCLRRLTIREQLRFLVNIMPKLNYAK
jgi:hypothetical protein